MQIIKIYKRYALANLSQFLLFINDFTYGILSFLEEINFYQLSIYDIKKLAVCKKLTGLNVDYNLFKKFYQKYEIKSKNFKGNILRLPDSNIGKKTKEGVAAYD